jgi:hypothetical protein
MRFENRIEQSGWTERPDPADERKRIPPVELVATKFPEYGT